ncbi:MAG: IS110 family transposase [Bacteroidetes bacterium]|nr:IS110 family transposase [Bacteroidota bacterium]
MNDNNYNFFCGIDISKRTLDFTFIGDNKNKLFSLQVANNKKGIKKLLNYSKKYNIELNKTLFCCENTGIYTFVLANLLHEYNFNLWIENAITIARSQGLTRGKNDLIDSYRIALYANRHIDKLILWSPKSKSLEKMKFLFAQRARTIKAITLLKVPLNEAKNIVDERFLKKLKKANQISIDALKEDLKNIDKDLDILICQDKAIKKNYDLAMSVPCIGKISAMYLLLSTENFSKIKTYRKAACYAGIAPFEYISGSSIRGKTRVSYMGNKYLKKLLHIGSLSVLKNKKGELYDYFKRKIDEGKHTMCVLNSLRNKLLSRVFACVTKGIEYNPDYLNKAN